MEKNIKRFRKGIQSRFTLIKLYIVGANIVRPFEFQIKT